ncbi:MAG TPA: hypothetical protein V6D29_03375 [Leptolyngbyaceae cyanobacterium]
MNNLDSINPINSMTAEMALDLVDSLVYDRWGCHLTDLERQIFLGSWQGKTYEEIYPLNPQYVEKSVGYKLWRKLSDVLGEKVSKKRIQGAVIRRARLEAASSGVASFSVSSCRIRVTYQPQNQVVYGVAQELAQILQTAGHYVDLDPLGEVNSPASGSLREGGPWDWLLLINPADSSGLSYCVT